MQSQDGSREWEIEIKQSRHSPSGLRRGRGCVCGGDEGGKSWTTRGVVAVDFNKCTMLLYVLARLGKLLATGKTGDMGPGGTDCVCAAIRWGSTGVL